MLLARKIGCTQEFFNMVSSNLDTHSMDQNPDASEVGGWLVGLGFFLFHSIFS